MPDTRPERLIVRRCFYSQGYCYVPWQGELRRWPWPGRATSVAVTRARWNTRCEQSAGMDVLRERARVCQSIQWAFLFGVPRALAPSAQIRRRRAEYPLVSMLRHRSAPKLGPSQGAAPAGRGERGASNGGGECKRQGPPSCGGGPLTWRKQAVSVGGGVRGRFPPSRCLLGPNCGTSLGAAPAGSGRKFAHPREFLAVVEHVLVIGASSPDELTEKPGNRVGDLVLERGLVGNVLDSVGRGPEPLDVLDEQREAPGLCFESSASRSAVSRAPRNWASVCGASSLASGRDRARGLRAAGA